MIFLGEDYRATAAYDRGLINDIYGVHSFDEDIDKRIKQLASGQIQVLIAVLTFSLSIVKR